MMSLKRQIIKGSFPYFIKLDLRGAQDCHDLTVRDPSSGPFYLRRLGTCPNIGGNAGSR